MKEIFKYLKSLKICPQKIEALKGDGSNRRFYRLFFRNSSLILILPQEGDYGLKEAEAYYELGKFFYKNNIPVPEIKFWDEKKGILIIEDLGDVKLCDIKNPWSFYYDTIEVLVTLQNLVSSFPIEKTLDTPFYNFEFLWEKEINYFFEWYFKKYRNFQLSFSGIDEIYHWAKEKSKFISQVVMHRDFQSKNIMIKNRKVFIIDFQGARLGPPSYDLTSLLLDPYVDQFENLEVSYKFLKHYFKLTNYPEDKLFEEFKFLGVIRLMQALAAYCKLTSIGKYWFKKYIPIAEKRLIKLLKTFHPKIYKSLFDKIRIN